jgi:hypothetical protein
MTARKHLTEQKAEKFLPTAKGNLNEAHARNLSLFKLKTISLKGVGSSVRDSVTFTYCQRSQLSHSFTSQG